jgi:hypothetical protein
MIVGFESSYLLARFNSSELATRVIDRTVKFSSYFFIEDVRCFASESEGGEGLLAGGDRRLETSRGLLGFSASALALTFAAIAVRIDVRCAHAASIIRSANQEATFASTLVQIADLIFPPALHFAGK